ncbi:MAG: hypothetical protein PHU71_00530 [Candidatus Gracilibacteria bacterium]|nr:hypothetical protein [Candidatus Gracilibacteria bacterium]
MLVIHPPMPSADPLGISGIDPSISQYTNLSGLVIQIVNFALGFVGIIAIIMVILGGFWYLTAAGKEDQAKKGLQTLMYALVGIVLISMAFVIVNAVTGAADSGFLTE